MNFFYILFIIKLIVQFFKLIIVYRFKDKDNKVDKGKKKKKLNVS